LTFKLGDIIERVTQPQLTDAQRALNALAGVNLSAPEARELLPRLREHKWYMSERLGRDVGWRVAAADYFENVRRPARAGSADSFTRARGNTAPPRLPMMRPLTQ
jgi:Domain of unknown function (DUF4032)